MNDSLLTRKIVEREALLAHSNPLVITGTVLAILTSLMIIVVLAGTKLKSSLYRFMLILSLIDLICSFIFLHLTIVYHICTHQRPCSYTLALTLVWSKFLATSFLLPCFNLFVISIEIYLTLQRLIIITDSARCMITRRLRKSSSVTTVSLLIGLGSFLVHIPSLCVKEIVLLQTINTSTHNSYSYDDFSVVRNSLGQNRTVSKLGDWASIVRVFLITFILVALNLITMLKLKTYVNSTLNAMGNYFYSI